MTERRDDLLDERVLRRALRFESDERLPRFDARAIALLARDARPAPRVLVLGLIAAVMTGLIAAAVWSAALDAAPTLLDSAVVTLMPGVIAVATLLVPIAQIAAEPAVPLSLLAALGVATLYELRERREHANVHAS